MANRSLARNLHIELLSRGMLACKRGVQGCGGAAGDMCSVKQNVDRQTDGRVDPKLTPLFLSCKARLIYWLAY